ncbi:MAG: hypothetical protein ACR2MM_00695 [Flavobacteriaceae bacterium]
MKSLDKNIESGVASDQWQKLFVLTEHWQSDLEFYKDDLLFLHHLVDKYFIWITKSENLEIVKEIMQQINDLQNRCRKLIEKVQEHRHNFAAFVKNPESVRWQNILEHHEEMEMKIFEFVKEFRANRKEVFRITGYVLDSEELTALIKS